MSKRKNVFLFAVVATMVLSINMNYPGLAAGADDNMRSNLKRDEAAVLVVQ